MRLWHLSHRPPASLCICAVSPEPLLFSHSMKVDEGSDQKSDIYRHWMAEHASLKNEFMEDEKYHHLMTWLIYQICTVHEV